MKAIGLMSGTSADGIDAALLVSDGDRVVECGPALTRPYEPTLRARLRSLDESAETALTDAHGEAVAALLGTTTLTAGDIDVIGFHGQTLWHRPEQGRTCQIGDGARLAATTGIDVVDNLRAADMRAGGQGAPLVPVYHRALATGLPRPLAVLNIGGVANVTWIGAGDDALLGFDTGPGNALLDDWAEAYTGCPFDEDGRLAAAGEVDAKALEALLSNSYFRALPPKSLDRDHFAGKLVDKLSPADGAATLLAFTASSVALAADQFPAPVSRWLVGGGGRHNAVLMAALAERLTAPVDAVEAVGWDGDALEAHAFAYLALRSLRGLPLTYPSTTGCAAPTTGGVLHRA
jgi:anhydro-N-acetylmuramic acid kinase